MSLKRGEVYMLRISVGLKKRSKRLIVGNNKKKERKKERNK